MASAVLVLLVSGAMLTVSLISTRNIAEAVAGPLMDAAVQETRMRLSALFDPIRRQIIADYAAVRVGLVPPGDAQALKDVLLPRFHALPQVGSAMLGDADGWQFLVMRYDEAAHRSPLLVDRAPELPPPHAEYAQFFTREVRPDAWGEESRWTLWSADSGTELRAWRMALPGYDPRQRPWHTAAMARFRDVPMAEALAAPDALAAWTDAYTMFTTKSPGISASVAARDPSGRILIVAYDLLLDKIADFTARAAPGKGGQIFVMTDDGSLLGPPAATDDRSDRARAASILQPAVHAPFPEMVAAIRAWKARSPAESARWSMLIAGERWWTGFSPFEVGENRRFWIGVLLPERDMVPEVHAGRDATLRITAAALLVAAMLALVFARGFSVPVRQLADQSRRITRLDLAETPSVRTHVSELHALSEALQEMRRALRDHISSEAAARREVEQREAELRTLTENTPDVVTRILPDGTYAYANPALQGAIGLPAEEVIGRRIGDLAVPSGLAELWMDAIREVVSSGRRKSLEFSVPLLSGPRDFESRIEPERDPSGEIVSVLVVSRDITERRQAMQRQAELETQLRQAQKLEAVGLLAGGVAHDFNNLLQVIGGSAAMISPSVPAQDNAELVQAIRDAVLRASQMTRQLLVFSRRQQPKLEALDLTELVSAHLRMLRRMMPEGIAIRFEPPRMPMHVMADPGGLEQVLLNLCVNARDAMPQGGTIEVTLQSTVVTGPSAGPLQPGRYVRLDVTDTGPGIPPDILERIFEPFFSTKTREKGTGLGLSVVYGIVRQHEGHIKAGNRPEGGAAFSVHLPAAESAPSATPAGESRASAPGRETVLLAEDDDQVRTLATRILQRAGYTVMAVNNGQEAVRVFASPPQPIDVLFLDILMPGLGGFETARRCREIRPDIPILFASGYAAESLLERVEGSAASEVLQKPYDPQMLLQAMRRLFESRASNPPGDSIAGC